jgi:hypothetical protein
MTEIAYFLTQLVCMLLACHFPVAADRSDAGNKMYGKG